VRLARALPGARLEIIEGPAHSLLHEDAQRRSNPSGRSCARSRSAPRERSIVPSIDVGNCRR
jgi:hypothetical protein